MVTIPTRRICPDALTLTYKANGAVALATAETFDPNDGVTTQNITIGTQLSFTVA